MTTATITITAAELRQRDPRRFEKEYYAWLQYAFAHDWLDYVYDDFIADCEKEGITVGPQSIQFSVGHCQSDYASFEGSVAIDEHMRRTGADQEYPALLLDAEDYRGYARWKHGYRHRGSGSVDLDYVPGNCYPSGVFADLPSEAWDELVEEQWGAYVDRLEGELTERFKDLEHELYQRLSDEYDHLSSEDSFVESCECNEVTFEIEEEEDEISCDGER